MSRTEENFFESLFKYVARRVEPSLAIGEIGFGLGISARLVQQHLQPARHEIVEIEESIFQDARRFAKLRSQSETPRSHHLHPANTI